MFAGGEGPLVYYDIDAVGQWLEERFPIVEEEEPVVCRLDKGKAC